MESQTVKDCGVCQEEFDEVQRCPRLLPCSHCLCNHCIGELIQRKDKLCPFCRQNFKATSAQELPKNLFSIDLLKYIKTLETKGATPTKSPAKSRSEMVKEMKRSSIETNNRNKQYFQMASDKVEKALQTTEKLKDTISENHKKAKQELMNEIKNLEENYQMKVRFLEEESERLKQQQTEIEKQLDGFENVENVLEAATSFQMVDSAIDKAEESHASAQTYLKKFSAFITNKEKFHEELRKNVKSSQEQIKAIKRILASSVEEEEAVTQYMKNIKLQKGNRQRITIQQLQENNPTTKYLVMLGGIYAVQSEMGKKRYARFSLYGEKLLLHYLKEGELPPNAGTIKYDDVMKMVDTSSRLMFLELSKANKEKLGKLFIRLSPDTKRATQFAILCLAEKGLTYAESKCLCLSNKGMTNEFLVFGDYENLNGTGGKAVVPDVWKEKGGAYERPALAGTVKGRKSSKGEERAAQFFIYTEDRPFHDIDNCFGMVEEGLHVLKEAISCCSRISDLVISDCGIVGYSRVDYLENKKANGKF